MLEGVGAQADGAVDGQPGRHRQHRVVPIRPLPGQHLGAHGYLTAAVSSFAERHRVWYFLGNFRESIRAGPRMAGPGCH